MTTHAKLEPHDFAKVFPAITEDEFKELAGDIKANGLREHIVLYQGKILDGNNRYRACELAGIEPTFADFTGIEADAKAPSNTTTCFFGSWVYRQSDNNRSPLD